MKSAENRKGVVTLDLPCKYEPDIKINLMSGVIEGKGKGKEDESIVNEEIKQHAEALFTASGGRVGKKKGGKK